MLNNLNGSLLLLPQTEASINTIDMRSGWTLLFAEDGIVKQKYKDKSEAFTTPAQSTDGALSMVPVHGYGCRMRLSTDKSISANTLTKLPFNTVMYDINGTMANTVGQSINLPVSGIYSVVFQVNLVTLSAPVMSRVILTLSSPTEYYQDDQLTVPNKDNYRQSSFIIRASAMQTMEVYFYSANQSAIAEGGSVYARTYINISLISAV